MQPSSTFLRSALSYLSQWSRSGRLAPLLMVAAALAPIGLLACGESKPAVPPRHVLFITVDTLRADHTSLLGYARATTPFLEELAAESTVFERAIVQWPKTGTSFASIFTGRYPSSTGLTHRAALEVPSELPILPEWMQAAGFRTLAVVSNAVLSKNLGWDRGFDEYVETWEGTPAKDPHQQREFLFAERVNRLTKELLDRHSDAERLFLWVHYSDPHAPYVLPAGRENPFLDDELFRASEPSEVDLSGTAGKAIGDALDLRFYRAQYDANVLEVDRALASLVEDLDRRGIWQNSVTIFTADHGESLGEHELFFEHGPLPHNPGSWVPLLVRGPGSARGLRVEDPVELVGTVRTLANLLPSLASQIPSEQIAPTSGWHLDPEAIEGGAIAFSEAGRPKRRHYRSVQGRSWKLVFDPPRDGSPPGPENYRLYDLEADPDELRNAIGEHPEQFRRLGAALKSWMTETTSDAEPEESEVSREALEALRAMGYVQ